MALRDIVIGLGVFSMMSFAVSGIDIDKKYYSEGEYYYGDNQTILNYKSQYDTIRNEVPVGYEAEISPPKFNQIPLSKSDEETLKIGTLNRLSFFMKDAVSSVAYEEIKSKSSHTFAFDTEQAILSPTDLEVTEIFPNIKCGAIPSFSSYFTGNGVTVVMEGNKTLYLGDSSMMNEYNIRIKLTNLSKTWQSIGHTASYKEKSTGKELFYTDFISSNNYNFTPGTQVAVTGKTGSIAEIDEKNSYVTITLEKRLTESSVWTSMTFGEFYGL